MSIATCDSPTWTANPSPPPPAFRVSDTVFPGTDLPCWVVENADNPIIERLAESLAEPDEPPSQPLKFPGPQPLSIDSSHFPAFRRGHYVVATKHDGVRACMFFIDVDSRHVVCLFDRKMDAAYVVFIQNVPRAFCQGYGTILDGELCYDRQSQSWVYVIFDCVMVCSLPTFHKPFEERLRVTRTALSLSYKKDPRDTIRLTVKTFVPLEQATPEALTDDRFLSDGFVFMPRHEPIRFGHHPSFFKLKTKHTVDFMFKEGDLYVFNAKSRRHVKAGKLIDPSGFPDGIIVECVLDTYDSVPSKRTWRLVHVRSDKNTANTLFVLDKTLLNIRENLSFERIQALTNQAS